MFCAVDEALLLFLFLILVSSHGSSDLLRFLTKIKLKTKMATAKLFLFVKEKNLQTLLIGFILKTKLTVFNHSHSLIYDFVNLISLMSPLSSSSILVARKIQSQIDSKSVVRIL